MVLSMLQRMLSTPTKKDEKDPNLRENSLLSLAQTIEAKLADTWSPEQISSTVSDGHFELQNHLPMVLSGPVEPW